MKQYHNPSTSEWYTEGQAITRRLASNKIFSGIPTEEMLVEWGFEEYVPPAPTPEQLLDEARQNKLMALSLHDSSDAVNSFSYFGTPMWISPADRANYLTTLQGAQRLGVPQVEFLGQTLATEQGIAMLDAINLYAMQCVGVTAHHKAAIEALTTIEDIAAYDYTTGYPEKLSFGN